MGPGIEHEGVKSLAQGDTMQWECCSNSKPWVWEACTLHIALSLCALLDLKKTRSNYMECMISISVGKKFKFESLGN